MAKLKDKFDYAAMLTALTDGRRFAFVRYSDGDWNGMYGRKGGILDEHKYDLTLGEALRAAMIAEPESGYHVGIMKSLLTPDRWWASKHAIRYVADNPEVKFCDSLILHDASAAGTLGLFFEALRGRHVAIIGHGGMGGMSPWLGDFEVVPVPSSDCWRARAMIEPRVLEAARQFDVVLFACSMPAKVWIRQAWERGGKASLIDVGSVFDPYIGRMSRGYMRDGKARLAGKLYG